MQLALNQTYTLQLSTGTDVYGIVAGRGVGKAIQLVTAFNDDEKSKARFKAVIGLDGRGDTISLASLHWPGHYLVRRPSTAHNVSDVAVLQLVDGSSTAEARSLASFVQRDGVVEKNLVSLNAVGTPHYLKSEQSTVIFGPVGDPRYAALSNWKVGETAVGVLNGGDYLRNGMSIQSANGQFFLCLHNDGKLALYEGSPSAASGNTLRWESGVSGAIGDYFLMVQGDGHLCVYKGSGPADNQGIIWGSGAYEEGNQAFFLVVQNDRNVVVYRGTGPQDNRGFFWATGIS